MQVRVMAACMESQADILECTASAQSGRGEVTVCISPMSVSIARLIYPPSGSYVILPGVTDYTTDVTNKTQKRICRIKDPCNSRNT